MPVDIHSMRSEVSIQTDPGSSNAQSAGSYPGNAIDSDQLREIIRDLVLEIIQDDLYTLFRMRGMR